MTSFRCFRCGRELMNATSVQHGIGPICRARQECELAAEEARRQENLRCHQSFVCYYPEHAGTTIARFSHRFMALAEQAHIPSNTQTDVEKLVAEFCGALGLNRPRVDVPRVEVPAFGRETIEALGVPPKIESGYASYALSTDHGDQCRHIKLRALGVCPFGLDCRDPNQAVGVVWRLLSIMPIRLSRYCSRKSRTAGRGTR